MRYLRLVAGLVIIAFALWIIVGEQMSGASADAVVNARLTTLRAPIAGKVSMPPRALGSSVNAGEEVASVTDALVDSIRLNDLAMERAFAEGEVARVEALIAGAEETGTVLAARTEQYRSERIAEIEARLRHAQERLRLIEQAGSAAGAGAVGGLVEEGQAGSRDGPILPGVALEYARERVEVLEIALRAARAGVFLGDGYNDAPFSEQKALELKATQADLAADLARARARLAAIDARVAGERVSVNRLTSAAIVATVHGQVWEVLAADGEFIQRGQDVLRLIDCGSAIVTASVSESVYNRLKIGDPATFRLSGDGQIFEGSVIRLAGSGAATLYRNLAIAPSARHLERYDVALLVPALGADPGLRCAVGRTGRVFFESRPLDWLRDLWG